MVKAISSYTDPTELRTVMRHAKNQNRDDVYNEALLRLCEVRGSDYEDPLERDFHGMLTAYEELLTLKNGKRTLASRTRQKLKNKGFIQCLEDWAMTRTETDGFKTLSDAGLLELTGEYLVTKYSARFSPEAVQRAQRRLEQL